MMPKNPSNLDELVGINSATGKLRSIKKAIKGPLHCNVSKTDIAPWLLSSSPLEREENQR